MRRLNLMNKFPRVLLPIAFVVLSGSIGGQTGSIVGKLLSAVNDAKDAYSTITRLESAAHNAIEGKKVTADGDWTKLAGKYAQAAKEAREAPVPSQFQSQNIVSVADLANCVTRPSTMQKLRAYQGELTAARQNGVKSLAILDERLAEVPKAKESLRYLISVHEKLMEVPVYGPAFGLDWVDLETRVQPALNNLADDLKKQREHYADDLSRMATAIANFQANLDQLSRLTCSCSGNAADASARFGGSGFCTSNVTMRNVGLSATIGSNGQVTQASLTGLMQEGIVGSCPYGAMAPSNHSYTGSGSMNGANVMLQFTPAAANRPRAAASFTGTCVNGRLNGTLTIRRNDVGGVSAWQTVHHVQ
jgi:hypothetical protein